MMGNSVSIGRILYRIFGFWRKWIMTQNITKNNIKNFIGHIVKTSDLNSIYDLWMILVRPIDSLMSEDEGILSFVGEKTTEESDKLYTPDNVIIPIFNSSEYLDGDVSYEE